MIKRSIGDTLRSKTRVAQTNEALLMVLCHNIRVLIHEMFELGIVPMFEKLWPAISDVSAASITAAQQFGGGLGIIGKARSRQRGGGSVGDASILTS